MNLNKEQEKEDKLPYTTIKRMAKKAILEKTGKKYNFSKSATIALRVAVEYLLQEIAIHAIEKVPPKQKTIQDIHIYTAITARTQAIAFPKDQINKIREAVETIIQNEEEDVVNEIREE